MDRDKTEGRSARDLLTPGRIVVLVLTVLALVFIFENTAHVKIRLIGPVVSTPLWVALLATFLVGVLCGRYLGRGGGRRSGR